MTMNTSSRTMFLRGTGALTAASLAGAPALANASDKIRFITVGSESGAAAVYASQRDFFKAAGVDVDVTIMANGGSVLPAVIGGSAEFGVSNPISLAEAFSKGAPIVCFAATVYYRTTAPNSLLMVAKDSPVKTARDLNGKVIAVNGLRNTPQLSTEAWLDKNGADYKTVKFTEVPFQQMGLALTSGRVDAAFFSEPALSLVRNDLRVLGDPYGVIASQFITGSYFTTRGYAAAQPAVVANVGRALRQAATWANAHPRDTAAILAKIERLDLERVETMARSIYAEQLRPIDMQPVFDVAFKYGLLSSQVDAKAMIM
jgi:NitT/TauT family transport system substrate-binding protein